LGRTFYVRVRSVDAYQNKSEWVESEGAEQLPGTPDGLAINFVKAEKLKHSKYLMKASWNEVVFAEADIGWYVVQMQSTDHEDTEFNDPDVLVRRRVVDAKRDDDANDYAHAWFGNISRKKIYRFRVRALTKGPVKGAFSDWFPATGGASPTDDDPPPRPENVTIATSATDRVVLAWDPPTISVPTRGTVAGSSGTDAITGTGSKFTVEVEAGATVRFQVGNLDTAITDSATSIAVNEDSTPPSTPFTIRVQRETMNVTARSGGSNPRTYTVTRGYAGTTNASHLAKVMDGDTYVVEKLVAGSRDTSLVLTTNLDWTLSGVRLHVVEEDPEVAFYIAQIGRGADVDLTPSPNVWSAVYAKDRTGANRASFKIPEADFGVVFYGRVQAVDSAFNRSAFVPATVAGNSDPDADGDGATINTGGGMIVATFTKPGDLRVRHYPYKWVNLTGGTLTFHKAIATCGDRENDIGHPEGDDIKLNLRRWEDPNVNGHDPIFDNGGGGDDDTRLTIEDGQYKDTNGPTSFDITSLLNGEAMTVKVTNVGSSAPGRDLEVQVFMRP
jgi:hypothetical protein